MAIELVNGGSVTCVDNNYNITYNGTTLRRIYACDKTNNVCTLVYCKNQLTVTYNYMGFDGVASYSDDNVTTGCFCYACDYWTGALLKDRTFGDYTAHMCYTIDGSCARINTYVTGTLAAPPVTTFVDNTPSCTGLTNGYCYCICTCNLFKTPTFCFVVQGDTINSSEKTFNCTHNIDYTSDTKSITYCATSITNPASYSFLGCGGNPFTCFATRACVRAIRCCFDTGVQARYAIVCVCDTSDGTVKCYCCPIGTSGGSITITTDF